MTTDRYQNETLWTWKGITAFALVLLFAGWLVFQVRGCTEHQNEVNAKARMDQKREIDRKFRFGITREKTP